LESLARDLQPFAAREVVGLTRRGQGRLYPGARLALLGAALAAGLGSSLPAATAAYASGPTLESARIQAVASPSSTSVTESFSLAGAAASVDNTLMTIPGVQVTDLVVTAGGRSVPYTQSRSGDVRHLRVAAAQAGFAYTVRYRAVGGDLSRVPLVVPVATPSAAALVRLSLQLPPGAYLQGDSFPVVAGDRGTVTASLSAMPSFVHFAYGPQPAGPFTVYNLVTALVVALIVALTLIWIAGERRALRRGVSGV
jgi:hypothetical protein